MLLANYLSLINNIKSKLANHKQVLNLNDKSPGFILQVRQNKQLIYEDYIGAKDQKSKSPINGDTFFLLGSLAKPALVNLIIENLNYFPSFNVKDYIPCPHSNLTIKDLIQHTSGLPDYLELLTKKDINHLNLQQLVEQIFSFPLKFSPGERFDYSNSGYVVLSLIISKLFGGPFHEVMCFLSKKSKLDFSYKYSKQFASNYTSQGEVYKRVQHTKLVTGWGDSLLYTSANEYHNIFKEELRYKQLLYKCKSSDGHMYYSIGGAPGVDALFCYLENMNLELTFFSNYTGNHTLLSDLILSCIENQNTNHALAI